MKLINALFVLIFLFSATVSHAEKITIAAAADLKFALDEIVSEFKKSRPGNEIEIIYGSSGKFQTQIRQGAPYDIFFSADIAYAKELATKGLASSAVMPYAKGRIVLWSSRMNASRMTMYDLTSPKIVKIAIANPKHAPYGKRAEEALRASGIWDKVQSKLVFGENIAHTAQFVQTGNAQIGILALSLALSPELAKKGGYYLIPDNLHAPLEQGYIITRRAADKKLAKEFSDYFNSRPARAVMSRYGFMLHDGATGKQHVP